jgi:hypothetical protein
VEIHDDCVSGGLCRGGIEVNSKYGRIRFPEIFLVYGDN